jgi:uncharacterized protein (TIGR02246 family)
MKTILLVSGLATAIVLPSASQSRVPADLRTAMQQRSVATARADAATWDRLTADSFTVVLGNGVALSKAQRLAQIKASHPDSVTPFQHETVQMNGNTTAVQRFQNQGAWVSLVWSKGPKGWRVTAAQVTPIEADSAATRQALEANNVRFSEAFMRGDASALASQYANDAVLMLSNAPAVEGGEAIKQAFMQFLSTVSVPAFKVVTHDVIISEDMAIERGTYEMTMHPKSGTGADVVDKGKYLTVWERQADGSWKIIRDISNSDLQPPK